MFGIDTAYVLSFMVYYSVKWSFNVFLFYCVCNTIAPAQTKQAVMDTSWWLLELFTVMQMGINRKKARFVKYISQWLPDDYVKQRKYGNVSSATMRTASSVASFTSASSSNNDDNMINLLYIDHDGYEILSHDKSKHVALTVAILPDNNVLVRSDKKTLVDIATEIKEPELAEKFLMTCIDIDKTPKQININLASPLNFYIVGNHILDLPFVRWYFREILKMNIIIDRDTKVNVIDGCANMLDYKLANGRGLVLQKVGVGIKLDDNGIPDIDDVSSDSETIEPADDTNKASKLNYETFNNCTCDTEVDCKLGEVQRWIPRDTKHTNNEKNKEE